MKNENKKQSQQGSLHLILIIALVLVALGGLGYVYWLNFMQPKSSDASLVITESADTTTNTTPAVAPSTVVDNFLTSFLSYKNSSLSGHTDVSFALQSSALTDTYENSIVNPSEMVYASPIILAQEIPSSFTVGDATTSSDSSSVPVALNFGSGPSNLIYNLILVGNEWKIDGVAKA